MFDGASLAMLATMTIAYVLPAIYQRVPIFGPIMVGPDNCYHHDVPQARPVSCSAPGSLGVARSGLFESVSQAPNGTIIMLCAVRCLVLNAVAGLQSMGALLSARMGRASRLSAQDVPGDGQHYNYHNSARAVHPVPGQVPARSQTCGNGAASK